MTYRIYLKYTTFPKFEVFFLKTEEIVSTNIYCSETGAVKIFATARSPKTQDADSRPITPQIPVRRASIYACRQKKRPQGRSSCIPI